MEKNSKEILDGIKKKRDWAIEWLIKRYTNSIRRFLWVILKNEEDAREMTQETFLRFLKSEENFFSLEHIRNYLFQIAHNLAVTKVKSFTSRNEELTDEITSLKKNENEEVEEIVSTNETRNFIRNLIKRLPEKQKKVIILRLWEELTFKEIANILSISEGTAKAHYFFGLKNLKEEITKFKGDEIERGEK